MNDLIKTPNYFQIRNTIPTIMKSNILIEEWKMKWYGFEK